MLENVMYNQCPEGVLCDILHLLICIHVQFWCKMYWVFGFTFV